MDPDALVVGGGFAGLATAAALAESGARVKILEQHHGPDSRFRGELIHPHGVRALERLGLVAPLRRAGGVHVSGFVVVDDEGPEALLPYARGKGSGLGIEHPTMVRTMREVVAARPRIELVVGRRALEPIRSGDRVVGVRDDGGVEHRAGLTIVADGSSSHLRKAIGLDADVDLLSYMVALAVTGDMLPHPGFGHVFLGGPGPILAYPFGPGAVRVCLDVPLDAPRGKAALGRFVSGAYAAALPGPIAAGVIAAADQGDFEVCANHRVHTRRCAVPGAVLVGDAGGCSHPLTATGMTCALHDAVALAETLADGGPATYETRRYRFVRPREVLADAVYEVLGAADEGSRAMKRGIMRYWRGSERARTRSIGILSGEVSDTSAFVAEYTLVTGLAALGVWGGVVRAPALARRTRETRSLFRTALGRIGETIRHTLGTTS